MKTKRGSYYVIKLGSGYYAGTRPIMAVATKTVLDEKRVKKLREEFPRYQLNKTWRNRYVYESEDILVPTAKYVDELTTDFSKAKKFRIHSKALAKAAELAKANSMVKTRPQVLLHEEGDRV